MVRLEALFSADKIVRDNYTALTKRIAQESTALQALEAKLKDAAEAESRRKTLQAERDVSYGLVFQAIINEQRALNDLYGPLMSRLAEAQGTLQKLGFSVRRIVDVEQWGAFAEEKLLDRRKAGPFNGRGSLTNVIADDLSPKFPPAWRGDLGVKSLALGSHLVHRLSLQVLHWCQVAQS